MTVTLPRGSNRVRLFSHFCHPLAELKNTPTTPRSWIRNKWGECDLNIGFDYTAPQTSQYARRDWFQFGNLALIEHVPSSTTNGKLPDWVGIMLNEDWNEGLYHAKFWGAECILAFRSIPPQTIKGTPAQVFTQIIRMANEAASNIPFRLGVVDDKPYQYTRNMTLNAFDEINQLAGSAGMDWNITPFVNEHGDLELIANLYARRGIDTGFTLTNANTELVAPLLSFQGTPTNHVFGYSHEQTSQARVMREGRNQASIDDYGELQINQVYTGIQSESVVQNNAQRFADTNGRPRAIIQRNILDVGDAFDWLDIGNTVLLHETRAGFNPDGGYGFDAALKILTMSINDLTNKLNMNVEVVQ